MSVVKEIRERLELSQMELAAKLGVHISTVQYWERKGISAKGYRQMTAITPDDLLDELLKEAVT